MTLCGAAHDRQVAVGPKAESAVRVMPGACEALDRVPGPCGSSHAGVLLEGVRKGCRSAQKTCRRHAEGGSPTDPPTDLGVWASDQGSQGGRRVCGYKSGAYQTGTCVVGRVSSVSVKRRASSVERRTSSLPKKDQTPQQHTAMRRRRRDEAVRRPRGVMASKAAPE
jgi:hypothetical protein